MKNNFISVGKILNFHGVKGEAKVGYTKNQEDFLTQLDGVYINTNGEYKTYVTAEENTLKTVKPFVK